MRHAEVKAAAVTDDDGWIDQPLQAGDDVWVRGTHLGHGQRGPAAMLGTLGTVVAGEDIDGLITVRVSVPGFTPKCSPGALMRMYAHQAELISDESLEAAVARVGRFFNK
jgi:hypothetical protein